MRIILYTGKGGVGKTTISAATAVRCAELGHNTIVMSTDPAHSLADSLDCKVGGRPKKIAENLSAEEIDVNEELKRNWGRIQKYVTKFLKSRGFEELIAEEFAVFPGMEELFSLLKLKDYYEKQAYDVAIIDCAPTASTVRMLSMPDVIRWYMDRFFDIERRIVKTVRPIAERITKVPFPTDDVYDSVEDLFHKVEGMKEILTNPANASIRLVFYPEKMVIKESQRAYSYLNLFGFTVDAVVANRIYPEEIDDAYFDRWRAVQSKYLAEARTIFDPLPMFVGKLFDREMVGLKLLHSLAANIFGDTDPATVFYKEPPIKTKRSDGRHTMSIHLPGTHKKDLNVWVAGEELIIEVGNYRRNILLPRSLAKTDIVEAKFEGDTLNITFGK
ncbi:MAG: ArsA family ATPase [Candidatus Abyssobacteria bacterium SURF_17]|uniref:arsenite-transporting ATPase n=1 Tax=Candidatus Abyssobacteria bacterium SURF_17 TaxID=2093361 RepID=A0A419F576_9BACT|nr:MAG: ArsA family ATPase [Candidatus Abyssubacteria bacterium SURF_17]